MGRARRLTECPRDPVGLAREEAAALIGVSATLFDRAVRDGLMPRPRALFGRLIWDADEVTAALRRLPKAGPGGQDDAAADRWGDVAA